MKYVSHEYDFKYLAQCLLKIGLVAGAMFVTGGSGFVICIPIIFFSLLRGKSEPLFFWLMLTVCMVVGNQFIMPKNSVFAYSQRGLMVVLGGLMALRTFGGRKHYIIAPYLLMMPYLLFMVFPSSVGWVPIISYLKLFLFTCIYFAYFASSNLVSLDRKVEVSKIRSAMLSYAMFFIFGSMALIPFPGISQLTPEELLLSPDAVSLFKGMTMHSQSLGPIISSLSVIIFADMIFSIRRFDLLYVALLICCPILIIKTSSRTGMAAYILGMGFVMWLMLYKKNVSSKWRSKIVSVFMVIIALLGIVILSSPSYQSSIAKFATKSRSDDVGPVTVESMTNTRMGLIERGIDNFKKKPLIGNGFQVMEVQSHQQFNSIGSYLSAPIEKGVWFAAILEEGGAIGFSLFMFFLLLCIVKGIKHGAYIGTSSLVVAILTNFGEFTLFSMSYTGGFLWAMVFSGLAMDAKRIENERAQMNYWQ